MERHLATLDQAIQQKEMLNKTIMQCVFMGIPRSGKTSLMKRIVVQVLVRPSAASVRKFDSTWTKLNINEEAAIVIMDTPQCHLDPVGCNLTPATDTFPSQLNPVVSDPTPAIDNSQCCLDPVVGDPATSDAVAAVPQPELTNWKECSTN